MPHFGFFPEKLEFEFFGQKCEIRNEAYFAKKYRTNKKNLKNRSAYLNSAVTLEHVYIHFGALRAMWRHIQINPYCSRAKIQIFPFFFLPFCFRSSELCMSLNLPTSTPYEPFEQCVGPPNITEHSGNLNRDLSWLQLSSKISEISTRIFKNLKYIKNCENSICLKKSFAH